MTRREITNANYTTVENGSVGSKRPRLGQVVTYDDFHRVGWMKEAKMKIFGSKARLPWRTCVR